MDLRDVSLQFMADYLRDLVISEPGLKEPCKLGTSSQVSQSPPLEVSAGAGRDSLSRTLPDWAGRATPVSTPVTTPRRTASKRPCPLAVLHVARANPNRIHVAT